MLLRCEIPPRVLPTLSVSSRTSASVPWPYVARGAENAIRIIDVQEHRGAAGRAQAEAAGGGAHRHHHRLAAHPDRPLHRGRHRRPELSGALYREIDALS